MSVANYVHKYEPHHETKRVDADSNDSHNLEYFAFDVHAQDHARITEHTHKVHNEAEDHNSLHNLTVIFLVLTVIQVGCSGVGVSTCETVCFM